LPDAFIFQDSLAHHAPARYEIHVIVFFLPTHALVGLDVAGNSPHPTDSKRGEGEGRKKESKMREGGRRKGRTREEREKEEVVRREEKGWAEGGHILGPNDVDIVLGRVVDTPRGKIIERIDSEFLEKR
jgi:hypothetical protein